MSTSMGEKATMSFLFTKSQPTLVLRHLSRLPKAGEPTARGVTPTLTPKPLSSVFQKPPIDRRVFILTPLTLLPVFLCPIRAMDTSAHNKFDSKGWGINSDTPQTPNSTVSVTPISIP